jgi:hypothetical protein
MASSAYMRFRDADQFASAVRAADTKIVAAGRGDTRVTLTQADLDGVWTQFGEEFGARTARLAMDPGRVILTFSGAGRAVSHWRGQVILPGTLVGVGRGQDGYHYTDGPAQWGSMSLAPEAYAEMGRSVLGTALVAPTSSLLLTPAPAALRRLQALHGRITGLARTQPWMLGEAEPVRALKQTMIEALADCLAAGAPREETAPQRLGGAIIARLDAMLEAAPDRPLYLPEVCAAVGVSRRTLHNYCHQHIGTSPERYLRLRRLYMARRRLQ